ncbi:MAG: hypothetical protein ACD_62C00563G0006 [uncultured bacterium]|nr:MAG: hypothetical protein ACD_62C00563G0006 [uncultured bacterium]
MRQSRWTIDDDGVIDPQITVNLHIATIHFLSQRHLGLFGLPPERHENIFFIVLIEQHSPRHHHHTTHLAGAHVHVNLLATFEQTCFVRQVSPHLDLAHLCSDVGTDEIHSALAAHVRRVCDQHLDTGIFIGMACRFFGQIKNNRHRIGLGDLYQFISFANPVSFGRQQFGNCPLHRAQVAQLQ